MGAFLMGFLEIERKRREFRLFSLSERIKNNLQKLEQKEGEKTKKRLENVKRK